MNRTYFAYANSPDGQTDFSLTRGDHLYYGRFTDTDRDGLQSAVDASVVVGGGRNLVLLGDAVKTPPGGSWTVGYDLSPAASEGELYTVSADILLDTASTETPRVVFGYSPSATYSDLTHIITDSWERYADSGLPGLGIDQDKIVLDGRKEAGYECTFQVKNVKLELGPTATPWTPAPEDVLAELDGKINDPDSYEWEEIRASTNEDWWSTLGVIRSKAVITLADATKVEVYGTDYIQGWEITQNLSSGKDMPVFDFVSDRLEMTLYSLDNDFNPFAEDSQYYGQFVLGTEVEFFVRVDYLGHGDELKWDAVGKFKIAEITVSDTGTECYVLAYDYGYEGIEQSEQQILAPLKLVESSTDVADFFGYVFPGYTIFIKEGITNLPKQLFPLEDKLTTINEFLAALYCFSQCDGNEITIATFDETLRANLDEGNIVALSPEQSLVQQYDSSVVKWHELGMEQGTDVVTLTAEFDEPGEVIYQHVTIDDGYLHRLEETTCFSSDGSDVLGVVVSDVYANALTLAIENDSTGEVEITVKAETVVFNEITEGDLDNAENVCELSNKFIQTKAHAETIKNKLDQFITTRNKYCEAAIRFNPLLPLAGLVDCVHVDFNVDMEAYIVGQSFGISDDAPSGRHTLTLLNKEAVS